MACKTQDLAFITGEQEQLVHNACCRSIQWVKSDKHGLVPCRICLKESCMLFPTSLIYWPPSKKPATHASWILASCRKENVLGNKNFDDFQTLARWKWQDNILNLDNAFFPATKDWLHDGVPWTVMEEATTIICLGKKSQLPGITGFREAKHNP